MAGGLSFSPKNGSGGFLKKYSNLILSLLFDTKNTFILGLMLWHLDFLQNIFIIKNVKYTEIDWKAYMQEVSGFLNGTTDYMKLQGDTGPLVYPAGFVYIFSFLHQITDSGNDIRFAQYIFMCFYAINLFLVIRIYQKTCQCPPYILLFICCASYRIHSIFLLRLFNDPVAMILLYGSVNCFMDRKWLIGSILFSLAVSVKMNVMLFAPGLLVILLEGVGISKTIFLLIICAAIQIVLAIPFLIDNPFGYFVRAFDFGRKFTFKWTVNWRFLPEPLFLNVNFHILLLFLHLVVLLYFAAYKWKKNFSSLFALANFWKNWNTKRILNTNRIVTVLFTSNFIGMCFSRSLHYQFYIWYYHTLPHLLWCTKYSSSSKLLVFGLIEICWNTYPSTVFSSLLLHACHIFLLYGLWRADSTLASKGLNKSK